MTEGKLTISTYEERVRRLVDLMQPLFVAGLYFSSVISGIYGLVFGIVALVQCKLEANKRVGKVCIILAIVNFALITCFVIAYMVLIFAIIGWAASLTSSSGCYGG
jgi:hypothetical protein